MFDSGSGVISSRDELKPWLLVCKVTKLPLAPLMYYRSSAGHSTRISCNSPDRVLHASSKSRGLLLCSSNVAPKSIAGNERRNRRDPRPGQLKRPTVIHSPALTNSGLPGDSHLLAAAVLDVDHPVLPGRTTDHPPTFAFSS